MLANSWARRILLLRRIGIPVESISAVLDKMDRMDETVLKSRLEELREDNARIAARAEKHSLAESIEVMRHDLV